MDDGFHAYDFESGAIETIAEPEAGVANTRFNDGKVDRRGRFIAGSLERDFAARSGALYRLDADLSVARIEDRVVCANGPCWSPDGATFYFTDGGRAEIYAYDYDAQAGTVAKRRVFAALETLGGHPDGATVDAEGYLWSAVFGGAKVVRLAPDGRLDRTVDLPAKLITSVMFGGADLDVLYVTSARGMGGEILDDAAEAGALFRVRGLGVTGLPEPRFAG
jgi:sugar lactone lactonase YvrE